MQRLQISTAALAGKPLEKELFGTHADELRQKLHTHMELCTNFAAQVKHETPSQQMIDKAEAAARFGAKLQQECSVHLRKVDKLLEVEVVPKLLGKRDAAGRRKS